MSAHSVALAAVVSAVGIAMVASVSVGVTAVRR